MFRLGIKALLVAVVAVTLSTFASAQSYDNSYFSAVFNAPVTTNTTKRNPDNTSTDYDFGSDTPAIAEWVTIRIIDHDIPNAFQSSDFYADQQARAATDSGGTVINRSQTWYQGHPVTYICTARPKDGKTYWIRTRYIIVSAREAIFITMISLQDDSNQAEWERFEATLNIK